MSAALASVGDIVADRSLTLEVGKGGHKVSHWSFLIGIRPNPSKEAAPALRAVADVLSLHLRQTLGIELTPGEDKVGNRLLLIVPEADDVPRVRQALTELAERNRGIATAVRG